MGKFVVQMIERYSGKCIDSMVGGEEFDTYEEAEEYSLVCSSDFSAGAEVLELAGEEFTDPDDIDYIVEELD